MTNRWFTLLFVMVATDFGWFTRVVWDKCGHGWAYVMAFVGFGLLLGVLRWWMWRLLQSAGQRSDERKGQVSACIPTESAGLSSVRGSGTPAGVEGAQPVCGCGHDDLPLIFHGDCSVRRAWNAERRGDRS